MILEKHINNVNLQSSNKAKKKSKKFFFKFIASSLIILGVASYSQVVNFSLRVSENTTAAITQLDSIQSYNSFKQKMDGVPYTDDMFKDDVKLFTTIFDKKATPDSTKMFYNFYDMKIIFDGNIPLINKYYSYYGDKNNQLNHNKQKEMRKEYNGDEYFDKAIVSLRMIKRNILPDYVYDNTEKYLKEQNLPDSLFFMTKAQNESLKIGTREQMFASMAQMNKENEAYVSTIMEKIKEGKLDDVKNTFKVANAYKILLSAENIKRPVGAELYKEVKNDKILQFYSHIPLPGGMSVASKTSEIIGEKLNPKRDYLIW